MLGELKVGAVYDYVDIARPLAIAPEIPKHWHIVIAEPQREDAAVERLRDTSFEAYTPVIVREVKAARGRKREVRKALWPSYLMVALPAGHEDWEGVRATRGVRDFLSIDGSKATLPDAAIVALRVKEAADEAKRQSRFEAERLRAESGSIAFVIGQEVFVRIGPFDQLFARIDTIDARGRIEVMLQATLLGRRRCAVDVAHIQPLS